MQQEINMQAHDNTPVLTEKEKIKWVYIIAGIFILLNTFFIANDNYYFNFIPFVILIILFAVFSLDKLILIAAFFTPLSIPLKELTTEAGFDMYLPTEPILFGVMVLFLYKLVVEKKFDKKILKHPVSIAIYINIGWIFITALTSSMPLVSIKFLVMRMWYVIAFYFIATQIFTRQKNIKRFIWLYIISFIIVIGYTIFNHTKYGLIDQQAAHHVMNPFYNDHTSYGALLAMFLPLMVGLAFNPKSSATFRMVIWVVVVILTGALVLSYTRAAWISVAAAVAVWLVIILKIKLRFVLFGVAALLVLFFVYQNEIFMRLEQNKQTSATDFSKHVKSISNITSDASNKERLNRWSCAARMFKERPFLGWGPGTYQFKYAPFQFSYEKSTISTNAGDMGNAHSEYLGPLAESGVLGMLTFVAILVLVIYYGIRVFKYSATKENRLIALSVLIGLITYFIHGFLNNFLDTDKASVPFWGFIGIIVALDVYYSKREIPSIENITKEVTAQQ